jgi:hypothetical protein
VSVEKATKGLTIIYWLIIIDFNLISQSQEPLSKLGIHIHISKDLTYGNGNDY